MSTKIAVMIFRSSLGGVGAGALARGVPQARQKRACAGFSVPHSMQNGMEEAYVGGAIPSSREGRIRTAGLLLPSDGASTRETK